MCPNETCNTFKKQRGKHRTMAFNAVYQRMPAGCTNISQCKTFFSHVMSRKSGGNLR